VIPITDAMREPRKFPKVLTGVMISLLCEHLFNLSVIQALTSILVLFGGAGALSYLTFGSDVNAVVLVNLDQSSKLTQSVRLILEIILVVSDMYAIPSNTGSVPLLARYSPFYSPPVFPCRENSREWTLCAKWQAKFACQMAQESLPIWACGTVYHA